MEQTGISHLARRRLVTLSAGERQLATLARGLAQEPQVLLLDEPAAHLDIGHQLQLFRALDGVRQCGVAVLAVIHDLARAAAWAGRMVLVSSGRIVAEGTPTDGPGLGSRGRGPSACASAAMPCPACPIFFICSRRPHEDRLPPARRHRDRLRPGPPRRPGGPVPRVRLSRGRVGLPALTRARVDSSLPSAELDAQVRRIVEERLPIYMLDEARLAALAPDVVVTQEACEVCAISYDQVVASLRRTAPRARVVSLQPRHLPDVLRDVRTVAEACGVGARGERLAGQLQRRLAALSISTVAAELRPRVAVVEWLAPPMLAGHWVPETIAAAGGAAVGPRPGDGVALRELRGDPRPAPRRRHRGPLRLRPRAYGP